jgi:hypothetical protein
VPHESAAAELLTQALADIDLGSVGFAVTVIDSQEDADRHHSLVLRRSASIVRTLPGRSDRDRQQ